MNALLGYRFGQVMLLLYAAMSCVLVALLFCDCDILPVLPVHIFASICCGACYGSWRDDYLQKTEGLPHSTIFLVARFSFLVCFILALIFYLCLLLLFFMAQPFPDY